MAFPFARRETHQGQPRICSLSDFQSHPENVVMEGEVGECVSEFIYLGSLIREACRSIHDLRRSLAITRHAMGELDKNVWSKVFSVFKSKFLLVQVKTCKSI